MPAVPSDLSLDLAIGPQIQSAEHINNYTSIQNTINSLIAILNGGALNDVLTLGSGGPDWAATSIPQIVLDRSTSTVDVANTVTETDLYSFAVSANTLATAKALRLTLLGDFLHNNVAGDTLTARLKFGAATFAMPAYSAEGTVSASRGSFALHAVIANLGATNSQKADFAMDTQRGGGGSNTSRSFASSDTLGAIDTTAVQTIAVTAQWSVASANNSWRKRYAILEIL